MTPGLLITGGSGFLGGRLSHLAAESGGWDVHSTFLCHPVGGPNAHRLDLRERAATIGLVAGLRPAVIIHQAVSPRSRDDISAIVPAARHLMDAAIDYRVRLIHVSTDLVFDGKNPPYADDAAPAPVNEYGAAKAFAEDLLMQAMPDEALIVRPSLIYGFDPIDRQTGWLVEGVRRGLPVRLFTNEVRCPIWVDTLSLALLELASSDLTGRLNLAGSPWNRWEFGLKMLACLGLEPGPTVSGAQSTPEQHRPMDLTLDCHKAHGLLRTRLTSIDDAFDQHCSRS